MAEQYRDDEKPEGTKEPKPEGKKEEKKPAPKEEPVPIICADFLDWRRPVAQDRFNLIHCDFPYGINLDKGGSSLNKGKTGKTYLDSPEDYAELLEHLTTAIDHTAASSAHMIFWFAMKYYQLTLDCLSEMEGWTIDRYPLIWDRGTEGVAPRPETENRRSYETAFFCYRGEAVISRVQCNVVSSQVTKEAHQSEKPVPMLYQLMGNIVTPETTFFDPTCGGGSSLIAAKMLGAKSVFGIEKDENNHKEAVKHYRKKMKERDEVKRIAEGDRQRRTNLVVSENAKDTITRLGKNQAYSPQYGWRPNPSNQQVGEQHKPFD